MLDHPAFGTADDGAIRFNYNQQNNPGGDEGTWLSADYIYPGAWFSRASMASWGTGGTNLKSLSLFIQPADGDPDVLGGIIGHCVFSSSNNGFNGWALYFQNSDNTLHFRTSQGSHGIALTSGGALTVGAWYHVAVTYDPGTDLWTLYLNGVVVDSFTQSFMPSPNSAGGLEVGGPEPVAGNLPRKRAVARVLLYEQVDEVDGYTVVLHPDDVRAIFAARDAGYGITSEVVHIGAGAGADPAAVHSFDDDDVTTRTCPLCPRSRRARRPALGGHHRRRWRKGTHWFTGSAVPTTVTGAGRRRLPPPHNQRAGVQARRRHLGRPVVLAAGANRCDGCGECDLVCRRRRTVGRNRCRRRLVPPHLERRDLPEDYRDRRRGQTSR